jgi:N-acetylglucosamine-6-sulfatase
MSEGTAADRRASSHVRVIGAIAATVFSIVAGSCNPPERPERGADHAQPPSIVLIVTDDQRWDTLWAMPTVQREVVERGIEFVNAFVSDPLCCPSRASILTGTYAHTTGVYTNKGDRRYAGFAAFDDDSTVATWLHDSGYRTGLFGKYFNGYHMEYVAPGWDRWFATIGDSSYYDYRAVSDGTMRRYGDTPADYGTTVLTSEIVSFIKGTDAARPLFAYFAPSAPHNPATPAPGDARAFANLLPWRPAGYNERDVSDKPAHIRRVPALDAADRREIDEFRRSQYRSLLAVDRAVGEILQALRDTGRLTNTLVVFTSDNGRSWGEHRWHRKVLPYEESIRVPFVVRFDAAIVESRRDGHLVVNVDVAPTLAELAGADVDGLEGRSLVPLFGSPDTAWRSDFLLEHMPDGPGVPTYCGVRNERYKYVRYTTGEQELYDLARDPAELVNRIRRSRYAAVAREMRNRLDQLCRPRPPGYSFG